MTVNHDVHRQIVTQQIGCHDRVTRAAEITVES